jgi:hypothetical protein
MTTTATAIREGVTTASLDRAWAIGTPMTPVGFYPRSGPLPAVVAVHGQTGAWDAPGQTRRLELSGGGQLVETLVTVARPALFVYELTDFRGPLRSLVDRGRAEWWYESLDREDEEASGTRICWQYSFDAKPGRGLLVRAVVRLLWGPYMTKVLGGVTREIDRVAASSGRAPTA